MSVRTNTEASIDASPKQRRIPPLPAPTGEGDRGVKAHRDDTNQPFKNSMIPDKPS
ncbi:MAG: hypothetical protein K0R44_1276 [Thermomicrobiales bacterium]|nr:hypothetical protein [Thermomicrobiales bacterium]